MATAISPDAASATPAPGTAVPKIEARDLSVFYGDKQALFNVSMDVREREVMAFIGPSGCGKSTFLRCINRMNDTIDSCRVAGEVLINGGDIYDRSVDVVELRQSVGMVFQKPNPFPKSIYENVAYGPRIHGLASAKEDLDEIVMTSLEKAGLLKEVKDRLDEAGTGLTAAAAVYRPCHRGQSRGDPDGRALFGPRSDCHRAYRGADRRAEIPLHHRHRHP